MWGVPIWAHIRLEARLNGGRADKITKKIEELWERVPPLTPFYGQRVSEAVLGGVAIGKPKVVRGVYIGPKRFIESADLNTKMLVGMILNVIIAITLIVFSEKGLGSPLDEAPDIVLTFASLFGWAGVVSGIFGFIGYGISLHAPYFASGLASYAKEKIKQRAAAEAKKRI